MTPDQKVTAATITIEERIHLIRAQRVVLAKDLAELYGVTTHRLNEQVARNKARFPLDFMFQPTIQDLRDERKREASEVSTLRFYRAWRCNGRHGTKQPGRCRSKHSARARIHPASGNA